MYLSTSCSRISKGKLPLPITILWNSLISNWTPGCVLTIRPYQHIMGCPAMVGGVSAADACFVMAPIKGRFTALVTDIAKVCYSAAAKNHFQTVLKPFDEVVFAELGESQREAGQRNGRDVRFTQARQRGRFWRAAWASLSLAGSILIAG